MKRADLIRFLESKGYTVSSDRKNTILYHSENEKRDRFVVTSVSIRYEIRYEDSYNGVIRYVRSASNYLSRVSINPANNRLAGLRRDGC